jgi:hypothetical protein
MQLGGDELWGKGEDRHDVRLGLDLLGREGKTEAKGRG